MEITLRYDIKEKVKIKGLDADVEFSDSLFYPFDKKPTEAKIRQEAEVRKVKFIERIEAPVVEISEPIEE